MRLTKRKKEILSYFTSANRERITREIGQPPYDVSGIAYLLHGAASFDKKSLIDATRRTFNCMVADGLLHKVVSHEHRHDRKQYSAEAGGVYCVISRYGLSQQ